MNDQIVHYLRHGDIVVRPDIERFDGDVVEFTDGTPRAVDIVVMATGYRADAVPRPFVLPLEGQPALVVHAAVEPGPRRARAIGFTEGDGGAYGLFDNMADAIARSARLLVDDPAG